MDHSTLYQQRASSIWYQKNLELRRQIFKSNIIPRLKSAGLFSPPVRVVDVGCGQGDKSDIIAQHLNSDSSLVSLELSPDMIKTAKRRYPRLGNRIVRDDALSLGKLSGKFDLMFYIQILQHFTADQVETAISKAVNFLAPAGKIITINTYRPDRGPAARFFPQIQKIYEQAFRIKSKSYKNLTVTEMRELFGRYGLRLTGRFSAGLTIQVLCFSSS